jgi:hypothetical protein
MKNKIIGMDGKPIASIDPQKIGIEDLIEMQKITKGRGTGLTMDDLLTVIIFELNRTKAYAVKLGNVMKEKDEEIQQLKKQTRG